jgi:hypothetical protein
MAQLGTLKGIGIVCLLIYEERLEEERGCHRAPEGVEVTEPPQSGQNEGNSTSLFPRKPLIEWRARRDLNPRPLD